MGLSRRADYGVRAMVEIASLPPNSKAVIPEIAERQEIPRVFLAKIIPKLAKAGLLRTYRGVSGGITLGQPAHEINLRQIIEAVEGPMALNCCSIRPENCPRYALCPVHEVWCKAQEDLNRRLESTLLSDLVRRQQKLREVEIPVAD
ncbi:MAG: RrF2 family transcriptional regulator [Anaerolineae bacterium]